VTRNKGLRLRVLRAERGLTQLAVARRLGMSQGKYWQIENGYTVATPRELARLASLLRVDVSELGIVTDEAKAS
jgi:transcriptional regulator with XRE-family HTH domain